MAVNPGSKITAANYNTLFSRVNNLLGVGSGQSGYGQTPVADFVAVSETVTAEHMELLRTDLNRINVHQTGALSNLAEISPGESIGANNIAGDPTKGFNAYLGLMDVLEPLKDRVDGTQVEVQTAITSERYSPWNGNPIHQFTATFDNSDHRRAFFNAGGEIHISAEISGDNSLKGQDWNTMLSNMGTIKFGANTTVKTGNGGVTQPIGNYDLTSSFQEIFERQGQDNDYAENRYYIFAKETSDKAIQFRIEFVDNDAGDPNVDESILGTLQSTVRQQRPSGAYVSVKSASYSNQVDLSGGA
jgi:hypothetical protein